MTPSIAVLVLSHNRVHLLRRCVEYVLLRTSEHAKEIVIWNNSSTDATRSYLDTLTDPRIRVVHHERNIGQNAYARAALLTSSEYLVELDDDVIDAPEHWDRTLLDAFVRLPDIGFLAASLVDDPHDIASQLMYRHRADLYTEIEENGVRLLLGPTGGGCAMTSRELYERVGGFRERKGEVFWLEDEAYIADIGKLGYRAAFLADLKVHHAGGPHYSAIPPEKDAYWHRYHRTLARKKAVKKLLLRLPLIESLNGRYRWFEPPELSFEEPLRASPRV